MIIGFTGSREGMTREQGVAFCALLKGLCATELHHGDCVGADAQAHDIARVMADPPGIIVHPPSSPRLRARKSGSWSYPPKPYLERNRDIVEACNVLVATPKSMADRKGETWWTILAASRAGKRVLVIRPDGIVDEFGA